MQCSGVGGGNKGTKLWWTGPFNIGIPPTLKTQKFLSNVEVPFPVFFFFFLIYKEQLSHEELKGEVLNNEHLLNSNSKLRAGRIWEGNTRQELRNKGEVQLGESSQILLRY